MKTTSLYHVFFLGTFLVLLLEFARILTPFLTPVLGAIILLILAYPLHKVLRRWTPALSADWQALLSTFIVTALIIAPFVMICWIVVNESQSMTPLLQQWGKAVAGLRNGIGVVEHPWLHKGQKYLQHIVDLETVDIQSLISRWGGQAVSFIGNLGRAVATNAILFIGYLGLMVFTLFFLFRDGEKLFSQLWQLIPMRPSDKDRVAEKLQLTVTSIIRGAILTAFFQMILATLGYLIARVPSALTLGFVTGVTALIPAVGTALIWVPVGLYFLAQGAYGRAIFIFVWGVVVISLLDNVFRTYFIGRKTSLPILFLFFSILGGVRLYGLSGLLLGPLMVAVIPVFIDIYREQYLKRHDE